jgi:hypothetical protein
METRKRSLALTAGCIAVMLLASGLVPLGRGVRTAAASGAEPQFTIKLTSGLFSLPANAASVDWMVVNDGSQATPVRVTVFRYGVNQPRVAVPPGALTVTVNPGQATHNANSVGAGKPFVPGFYYEVVVETASPSLHPSVEIWSDMGGTAIAGTLIPPGEFIPL